MTPPRDFVRVAVALALAGTVLLSGCGGQNDDTPVVSHSGPADLVPRAEAAAEPAEHVGHSHEAAPLAAPRTESEPAPASAPRKDAPIPVEHVPTELPPGDPGPDAPAVQDPGKPEHDREHEEPARTTVPDEALLDAGSVGAVLGGSWEKSTGAPVECAAAADAVAARAVTYRSGAEEVQQTVATHRSLAAADRAVAALGRQLQDCGWSLEADPRIGTASTAATSRGGTHTAVVVSAEGVTVTLVGTAGATTPQARWSSLADLALGSSCAAAPHGCH